MAARAIVFAGSMSSLYACSHAWDEYDPRLSSASSAASSASSVVASSSASSSSGTGGASSASSSSASSSSSTGGAGGGTTASSTSSTAASSSSGVPVWDGGACVDGALCYTGPAHTLDAGTCSFGRLACTEDAGPVCTGQTLPTPDDCSSTFDRDCNGVVNDHCGVWSLGWGMAAPGATTEAFDVAVTDAGHVLVTGGTHGSSLTWSNGAGPSSARDGVYTLELDAPSALTFNQFGGDASVGTGAALDGDGGAYVIGAIYGSSVIDFVSGYKNINNGVTAWGLFAGQLLADQPSWFAAYPGITNHDVTPLAFTVAPSGSVYIVGNFTGPLVLDGGLGGADAATLPGAQAGTGLVMALNEPKGALAWTLALGGAGPTLLDTVAVTSTGKEIVLGGSFHDASLTLNNVPVAGSGTGIPTGLVATVEIAGANAGTPQVAKPIPTTGSVSIDSIAVRGVAYVVTGRFTGTTDFSQRAIALAGPDAGFPEDDAGTTCGSLTGVSTSDLFVMYLRSDLSCLWVQQFGGGPSFAGPTPSPDFASRLQGFGPQVAVDANDAIYVAANMAAGSATFGSWTVNATAPETIVLMNLVPGTGLPSWVRSFASQTAYVTGLAVDGTGDVYMSGQFQSQLEIVPSQALTWPNMYRPASFVARIAGGT